MKIDKGRKIKIITSYLKKYKGRYRLADDSSIVVYSKGVSYAIPIKNINSLTLIKSRAASAGDLSIAVLAGSMTSTILFIPAVILIFDYIHKKKYSSAEYDYVLYVKN